MILPSTAAAFLKEVESFANDKRWVSQLKDKLEKINIVPQQRAKIIRSIDQLVQLATESSNSEKMLERAFQSIIGAEFLNSICTYNTEMSEICFSEEQGKDITIQIKENKVTEFKCKTETFVKDATLVESPLYIHLIDILQMHKCRETLFQYCRKGCITPADKLSHKGYGTETGCFPFLAA